MKYCCDLAYFCPDRNAITCYRHGGTDPCCPDEQAHRCLRDTYGSEDGLMFGDGFSCSRCGNYELVGMEHEPPSEPGFPVKGTPATDDDKLVFVVDETFDSPDRAGLLIAGRVLSGVATPDAILRTYQGAPIRVLALEAGDPFGQATLLIERGVEPAPGQYLTV